MINKLYEYIFAHNNYNTNLFNNINGYKLDRKQIKAVISKKENTLVIAGAGSGKSLTIIAKIRYLVEELKVNPKEILCISLTNDACNNLLTNLNKNVKYKIDIYTFHKLALNIIKNNNRSIKIANTNTLDIILNENNTDIDNMMVEYITKYIDIRSKQIKTLDGIIVYNKYDYLLSSFLYINRIKYTYYYKANKSIFYLNNTVIILHHKEIYMKRKGIIDLFDKQFDNQEVYDILSKKINLLKKRNKKELFQTINKKTNYVSQLNKLIITFTNLFKSAGYTYEYFEQIIEEIKKENRGRERKRLLLLINMCRKVYIRYENKLNRNNEIDFNDMIIKSTQIVQSIGIKKYYKYIIIDEFQDTSYTKYMLVKSIKDKCNAKLIVVGDDWQSIYAFTGCSLDIFINFKKYFGKTKIIKLNNTYRNSKELIRISRKFIQKNKYQIKKRINSKKHKNNPINYVFYNNNFTYKFEQIINNITNNKPIMVLGRNNADIDKILDSNNFILDSNIIKYKKNPLVKIYYLTVHKSKGLEEENVIIINTRNDTMGFPNKIVDDSILKYVKNKQEYYPYEEERRLFYVALTRTKNNLYIMVDEKSISPFVKEIIKLS